jgi:hypothetical protein
MHPTHQRIFQIRPYFIYLAVARPPALSMLQVQEAAMALLPIRLMLLCQHYQLCIPMDLPTITLSLCRVLLS